MKWLLTLLPFFAFGQTITLTPIGNQDVSGIPVTVEQLVPGQVGYNINAITYFYESTGGTSVSVGDDQTVSGRPIGFTFNYWGTNYTTVNICSNGWISFTNTGGNIVGYGTNSTVPAGIHGVALDLYPSGGYFIRYQTLGTAPDRKFVVSYHMDYYGCRGNWTDFQIVLYETSNKIAINVATHPTCGNALQGLSNQANNGWAITPGRNGQNWTGTTNSSYEFTPYSTSSTWTSRGTLNTNQAGQVTFSNTSNYDYRVTIDVSAKNHLLTYDDLNYMMYKKANLSSVSDWDFYTLDLNNSSVFGWEDIIWGHSLVLNGVYHKKYIFTQSEKTTIESNPTTNYYNTYFPTQVRTVQSQNQFYIMGTGKHKTIINNLYKIE